ncbi:MAG: pilus assembly protein [Streptosporangiales bacterium]|nr:pilus assembly protein [Streptosporangiales bacterium]
MTRRGEGRRPRRRGGGRTERGVSSIELALLTPVLLLLVVLTLQFAMAFHARHVALAAAREGARVARNEDSPNWDARARERALAYVRHIGPRLLESPSASAAQVGIDEREVVVRGIAVRVVPFLDFEVVARSRGPQECFRPDVGGGVACG